MLLQEQRVSTGPWEISTARLSTRGNILTAPPWGPQGKTREELLGFFLYDLVCETFRLRLVYSFNKYLPEAAACMSGLEDSKGSSVIRARAEAKSERTCQGAKRPALQDMVKTWEIVPSTLRNQWKILSISRKLVSSQNNFTSRLQSCWLKMPQVL